MSKKKAIRKDVVNRLMKLSEYLNQYSNGLCTDQDYKIMEAVGYNNRKTLQRDLKRLEGMNYVQLDSTTQTPVSIADGTARQFIRKTRVISFLTSQDGLRPLPRVLKAGDAIGKGLYKGTEITYLKEDRKTNSQWIIGWEHTLVLNPDYQA